MFDRIKNSSKVQAAFLSLVVACLVAAAGGSLDETMANKIVEIFMNVVLPVLLGSIALEDAAKKLGQKEAGAGNE